MELSPRLLSVAKLVPQGACFADIGTDHAFLPVWLLRQGIVSQAIAADLREGPLDTARKTARRCGEEERLSFRLCNGLSGISPDEVDTIAIAGMGGGTIAEILAAAPWTKERPYLLLLQPMSSFPDLRDWLSRNGYVIESEHISCEANKLYTVLSVRPGVMPELTPGELWAGKQSRDPLRGAWLDWCVGFVGRALKGMEKGTHRDENVLVGMRQAVSEMTQMKKEWDTWNIVR